MKNVLLAIVIAVLIATTGFFARRARNAESQLKENATWVASFVDSLSSTVTLPPPPMFAERDSLYLQWVAVNATMNLQRFRKAMDKQARQRQDVLDQFDIANLKEQGLTNPTRQLRQDLVAHPSLISFPGVLGGTMQFHESDIVLLEPPYALAGFEDGHIGGHMLLSYEVKAGKITWKRLWSALE